MLTKHGERLDDVDNKVLVEFGAWPRNVWIGVVACSPLAHRPTGVRRPLRCPRRNGISWVVIDGESSGRDDAAKTTKGDALYPEEESKPAGCHVFSSSNNWAPRLQFSAARTRRAAKASTAARGGHSDQWPGALPWQHRVMIQPFVAFNPDKWTHW